MTDINSLEETTLQIRRDILRMVHKVNSGHPGGSLGCTEFFVALYFEIMEHNTAFDMDGKNEDLFFLSNGHISPVFYSTLARRGYFPVEELNSFRLIDSRLQGHPTTHEGLPGIRIANWEALMYAAGNGVDNLIATVDLNGKQIDGTTEEVLSLGDVRKKFEAFGWDVLELSEGNSLKHIIASLKEAKSRLGKQKPVAILMQTEMGNGVSFMMHTHAWHGKAPNDEQLATALSENKETIGDY